MPASDSLDAPATTSEDRRSTAGTVFVNGRFRVHQMTGLQRYAEALVSRFGDRVNVVEPRRKLMGATGHAWEQIALPARIEHRLLWSPCNTGPVWLRRQVVTIHDMFFMDHPEWFSRTFARVYGAIVPKVIRSARRIIAVSEYTRQRIIALVGDVGHKITVVHSGIGPQFSRQSAAAIDSARAAVGVPGSSYFLSVSSLEPRKNLRGILLAWEAALPHLPADCWLVLVGHKGKKSVFAPLGVDHVPERVFMAGYVDERHLPGLYAGAMAFVFPSLAEGFGFPPLEAMACGVPVLTANSSSLVEVAGGAAYLVDPLDVQATAKGMCDLAGDDGLRHSLRERGLAHVRKYDWDNTAGRTWDVLAGEMAAFERERRVS